MVIFVVFTAALKLAPNDSIAITGDDVMTNPEFISGLSPRIDI
jgi:hypothetical protein